MYGNVGPNGSFRQLIISYNGISAPSILRNDNNRTSFIQNQRLVFVFLCMLKKEEGQDADDVWR